MNSLTKKILLSLLGLVLIGTVCFFLFFNKIFMESDLTISFVQFVFVHTSIFLSIFYTLSISPSYSFVKCFPFPKYGTVDIVRSQMLKWLQKYLQRRSR